MKNAWGKTRKIEDPYATFRNGEWTYKVLKAYQSAENERKNPYARWFMAVSSPFTYGEFEMGDTYIKDVADGLGVSVDSVIAVHETGDRVAVEVK